MRRLTLLATIVLWVLLARAAWPQGLPVDCTFPSPPDTLLAKRSGEVITSADVNQMRCILNRLQERALGTPGAEVLCVSPYVPKGERVPVTLTAAEPIPSSAAITVAVGDGASPPLLTADLEYPTSQDVRVWVWNHHPDQNRLGVVCVTIHRP